MSVNAAMIVGLGNPGPKYETTRHNIGFLAVDALAEELGCSLNSEKMQGLYCRERFAGEPLLLVKPLTYMNRSGECVARFCQYFKVDPARLLVVHDDIDLPFGRVKVTAKGGHGGHNGIRSIIQHLGVNDFARVKIGLGRPEADDKGHCLPVDRFVLSNFSQKEWAQMEDRLSLVSEAARMFLAKGVQTAMNEINGRG